MQILEYTPLTYLIEISLIFQVVKFWFSFLDLHHEKDCLYDNLLVYDGRNERYEEIGRFCGSNLGEILFSSRRQLYVIFNSDQLPTNNRGFTFRYDFVPRG